MPKPKECPKCKAGSEEINNAEDMCNMFGLDPVDYKKWARSECGYLFDNDEAVLESWYSNSDFSKMKLSQIAAVIIDDWKDNISPNAWPYVEALMNLDGINDSYGQDDAKNVISFFLSNAREWQGVIARKIKKHLQKLLREN